MSCAKALCCGWSGESFFANNTLQQQPCILRSRPYSPTQYMTRKKVSDSGTCARFLLVRQAEPGNLRWTRYDRWNEPSCNICSYSARCSGSGRAGGTGVIPYQNARLGPIFHLFHMHGVAMRSCRPQKGITQLQTRTILVGDFTVYLRSPERMSASNSWQMRCFQLTM